MPKKATERPPFWMSIDMNARNVHVDWNAVHSTE